MSAARPLFCTYRMGCSPQELEELLLDLAIERQRAEIEKQLFTLHHSEFVRAACLAPSQSGQERPVRNRTAKAYGQHEPNPNPNAGVSQAYPKGRWT